MSTRTNSNVISFAAAQSEARAEAEFAKLLDKETKKEGNVEPLSIELIQQGDRLQSRIDKLRAQIAAKQHSTLLEG
ncbi:hypothetical protein [Photobacterium ganghwense]|uniref:hypothetical protein n=1 Tax=Photobacterium ganghwense TaxID=320778 RepID=UPI0039EF12F7